MWGSASPGGSDDPAVAWERTLGNPYDRHTLAETLEQIGILADRAPATAIVDRRYRGVEVDGVRILRSGQRRGITRTLKAKIQRRSAIEPKFGHMKMNGRLGRNPLKGALGDALHAVLCGAGPNLRLLIKQLRLFCAGVRAARRALLVETPCSLPRQIAAAI